MNNALPISRRTTLSQSATRPLGVWIALVTLINIVFATTGGYGSDIGDWVNWINQLKLHGYDRLAANYPPVVVHWFWLLAKFYASAELLVTSDSLLRFLANTPVLLAHVGLILLVDKCAEKTNVSDRVWNLLIALVALNPALLMNGPLWGQVDAVFCLLIAAALVLLIDNRQLESVLVFPLLTAAVLTKFQAICIAPVLLPLLWHRRRDGILWRGLVPALLLATLLLMPYLLAGSTALMFKQTYLLAPSLFPFASFNGDNLWYLIGLNTRPDNLFIFNPQHVATSWQKFFTPKVFGIFLFALWSLGVCVSSFRRDEVIVHWRNAILAPLGFFMLLPGMHERYLLPAVVIACVATASRVELRWHAVILTLLSAANMLFHLHPEGGLLPYVVSAATIMFAVWATTRESLAKIPWSAGAARVPLRGWILLSFATWAIAFGIHLTLSQPDSSEWMVAANLSNWTSKQDWGALRFGRSVGGNKLTVAGERVAAGLGTHANSSIVFPVPPDATNFSTRVGVDDETSSTARLEFIIKLDNAVVWRSGPMVRGDRPRAIDVATLGKHRLELVVDALGDIRSDHADWLQPRFYKHP